jgi:phosphoribosylamine--glycine ligase
MRVLLLGGGGREHAIGWKLSQSPLLDHLTSCPGNPGLRGLGDIVENVDITDPGAVLRLATDLSTDLVVIGPEAPLAAGVADTLRAAGVAVFGPGAEGARLESSKTFAKLVMERAHVPTAAARTFTDRGTALDYLTSVDGPYVVKADGLAAGKGVLVSDSLDAARAWVDDCLTGRFAGAGASVVIEEYMDGDEVSVFYLCAGGIAVPLEPARDYKRLSDGDIGPNTGGMGAYSPVEDLPLDLVQWTTAHVADPTLAQLASMGIEYTGFLYVGLMLTDAGPRVVEFNCRLGDPETQAVLPRLESDLLQALYEAVTTGLAGVSLEWSKSATVNVVLATSGYPDAPRKGDQITFDELPAGTIMFHAGTRDSDGSLETSGGRVLNVVGQAGTIEDARTAAYDAVDTIKFNGMQNRTDIGAPNRGSAA